jgi:3-deoxy-D-manno-octulosonic-acid transferase
MTLMLLYRLLIILLSPVIISHILWLALTNKQSHYFWQRLGYKLPDLPTDCLWFHCASVGEVNTLLPLLNNINKQDNSLKIIITTNTITGGKIVAQQKLDFLFHCYMPVDWRSSIDRFLAAVKPSSIYIMETEIWPNLFVACQRNDVPIYIINARLSSRTTSAKSWIKQVYKSCLLKISAIYARSEKDAQSYRLLGAKKEVVTTVGNLKFTTALANETIKTEDTISIGRKYILIASTHKDEEEQIYNIWKKLKRPELLIIAPRHPERSASIIGKLDTDAIAVRSKNQQITDQTEIYLLDTIGELKNYFGGAELVIMGGSFIPVGGHNILEPASFNCAIITGPYMENFTGELELMLSKKAIIQITSKLQVYSRLREEIEKVLNNDDHRETLKHNTTTLSHNVEKILNDYTDIILRNN